MANAVAFLVAGWFGSAVIKKLTDITNDAVQEKNHQLENTQKLLEKLNLNLPLVRKLVDVAASRLIIDSALSDWLKQIKDVLYETDDLLDELEYEKLWPEVSTSEFSPADSIKNFLSSNSCILRLKNIVENLQEIASHAVYFIEFLKLYDGKNDNIVNKRNESISLMNDDEKDEFLGRDEEINIILDILLNTSSEKKQKTGSSSSSKTIHSSRKELIVLPIVGIGGVGKTTLAKVIFNNQAVQDHFDLKAWVYVSDTRNIMFEMINLFRKEADINRDDSLEKMKSELVKITSNKSFFVLDDVSDKFVDEQWENIKNALRQWANGSAVLITTQSARVAQLMGTKWPINLGVLNENDYWNLFKYHAFGKTLLEENKSTILENIGQDISRKMNCLPLAATVLGKLLNHNINETFWLSILESEWWDHEDVANKIIASLGLSYQHLDTNLKQCFAYCSILPHNHYFRKHHIVMMWIAQGYIQPSGSRRIEDIGNEWFDELTRRSILCLPETTGILCMS